MEYISGRGFNRRKQNKNNPEGIQTQVENTEVPSKQLHSIESEKISNDIKQFIKTGKAYKIIDDE